MGLAGMKQFRFKDVSLAYVEGGEAQSDPVFFVHGSVSDYRTWEAQMEVFAEKHHVFAYSRRSHYPNPYVEYSDDYSIKVEAEDLAGLIQNVTSKPVHLVGWSYGAFIAAVLARNHSRLVHSLVLAEPPIMSFLSSNVAGAQMYLEFKAKIALVKKALAVSDYREAVKTFIDAVSGTGAFEHTPQVLQERMLQNGKTLYELTSPERDSFTPNDAKAIKTPTLLVSGEKTTAFLKEIIIQLQTYLPNNECVTIAKASHPMHSQNPREYNKAVLNFLARGKHIS